MKELHRKILECRSSGMTYSQIRAEIGCAKSTISYYLNDNEKKRLKTFRTEKTNKIRRLMWRHQRIKGCEDCGIKDPTILEYDHDEREKKFMGISKMIRMNISYNKVKDEIRKCTVRCCNCHRKKTAKDLNWKDYS